MDESELKAAFAAFLIAEPAQDHTGAFAAALKLFPAEKDRGEACRVAFAWPTDPEVIIELQRLRNEGVNNAKVPTKEQVIETLWDLARNEKVAPKDRAVSARIVAEMMNFIPKAGDGEDTKRRMPTAPVYQIVEK